MPGNGMWRLERLGVKVLTFWSKHSSSKSRLFLWYPFWDTQGMKMKQHHNVIRVAWRWSNTIMLSELSLFLSFFLWIRRIRQRSWGWGNLMVLSDDIRVHTFCSLKSFDAPSRPLLILFSRHALDCLGYLESPSASRGKSLLHQCKQKSAL